jgi:elongin-A
MRRTDTAVGITEVGVLTYAQIKPVLEAIESPTQLHLIETNSPHIRGEDAELWQKFIARDIPKWREKNYVPSNPLNWHKVYRKYKKEQDLEVKRDEETLRETMEKLKQGKSSNVSKIVDISSLPKMPRDPKMKYNAGVPIKRGGIGFKKEGASSLSWTAGSKTKLTDGQSVLTRARREAKEITARGKLSKPTNQLGGGLGQIRKAPAGMVSEYRRAEQPPIRILARKRPEKISERTRELQEREDRLRALTSGKKYNPPAGATVVSSSEESDHEFDSADDLFDVPRASASKPRQKTNAPSSYSRPSSTTFSSRPFPSTERGSPPSSRSDTGKPSDRISSLIGKPKPVPRSMGSSPMPSRGSSPAGFGRSPSPHRDSPKPKYAPKRPPVDVFNRKPKRPRMG